MKARGVAFVAGVVFAIGLALSGMTDPSRVLGFLDFTGAWDPSLAFVMIGAVGVHAAALAATRAWPRPRLASTFRSPKATAVDLRLVGGAALFGVGWGLSGVCPGPALVSLGSGSIAALVLVAAIAAGATAARPFRGPSL